MSGITYITTMYLFIVIVRANPSSCPCRRPPSEHQEKLCFVGQNARVQDRGFHLATHSLATCVLNVTPPPPPSSSSAAASSSRFSRI